MVVKHDVLKCLHTNNFSPVTPVSISTKLCWNILCQSSFRIHKEKRIHAEVALVQILFRCFANTPDFLVFESRVMWQSPELKGIVMSMVYHCQSNQYIIDYHIVKVGSLACPNSSFSLCFHSIKGMDRTYSMLKYQGENMH